MFKSMLVVGCGGFLGTCGRFLVGRLCKNFFPEAFPLGTLAVNLLGCFLIGLFVGMLEKGSFISSNCALFLITGFCGGFTTYSAFADEMFVFAGRGQWAVLAMYLIVSIVAGILLVGAGRWVVR